MGVGGRLGYTFTKPHGLLAHDTTAATVFEHILPTGKLRLSPYRLMRDPVKNKDILPSVAWRGDQPQADRAITEVYAHLKAARDRMRVLSGADVHDTSVLAALLVALAVTAAVLAIAVALVGRGWRLRRG